jgi:hypothetical protein
MVGGGRCSARPPSPRLIPRILMLSHGNAVSQFDRSNSSIFQFDRSNSDHSQGSEHRTTPGG